MVIVKLPDLQQPDITRNNDGRAEEEVFRMLKSKRSSKETEGD
jgi:hypothetical protein